MAMVALYRNLSTDLQLKSSDWFLSEEALTFNGIIQRRIQNPAKHQRSSVLRK